MAAEWNPRYRVYARRHGKTPEEMLAHDEHAWPGGRMAGFMLWISQQWTAWAKLKGMTRTASGSNDTPISEAMHEEFTGWLEADLGT